MSAKDDWAKAERAAEHWLLAHGCVATRRAVRNRFHPGDFFGCDVIGRLRNGATHWVQVTTGSSENVAQRRRKIEILPWIYSDIVQLLEMRSEKNGRSILYRFRVHEYRDGKWVVHFDDREIPRVWFKAVKR